MAGVTKGMKGKLRYSQSARHRICIGISWDATEEAVERPEQYRPKLSSEDEDSSESRRDYETRYGYELEGDVKKVKETFDLDLICLVFNKQGEIVDAVSPMEGEEVDQSGMIYHSGDERHGVSANDDEVVAVELKDLPGYASHLVFLAIIQSGHTYGQVVNPEARIYDSLSNKDLLRIRIPVKEGEDQTAFIFSRVYRGIDGWMVHYIGEFRLDHQVEDWAEEVKRFLTP